MGCCLSPGTRSLRVSVLPIFGVSERLLSIGAVKVAYLSLALFHVNLITEHNEGEVLWVVWARLYEKLISPTV